MLGVNKVGYVTDINSDTLSQNYNGSVIGMTDNSNVIGGPVTMGGTYGVFAFLPAHFVAGAMAFAFNITLFALFDSSLKFSRFYVRGSWGSNDAWKEVTLI